MNYLASTPFNVAVGGTMFNENGDPNKYWTSTPPISETAISYIPENVWNESSLANGLWSGSGGASAGNIQSGFGTSTGVPKPSWQYGVAGIPDDGVHDLPDISLTAAGHDPYLLCFEGSCTPDSQGQIFVYFISGTSASAPSFAGMMALMDQAGSSRQGLPNYIPYRLAATQSVYPGQCDGSSTATLPASNCIFNDVTVGTNTVPGEQGTEYQAATGYDLTTGLGSVNVGNLYENWGTVTFNPTTTALSLGASDITHGSPMPFSITVTSNSGTGVPSGDVSLIASPSTTWIGPSVGFWTLSGGSVSSSTNTIPGGNYQLTAHYPGDNTFAPSASPGSSYFTVSPEPSTIALSVLTVDANGNQSNFASGPFGSFVYLRADVAGQSGHGVATGTVTFSDSFGSIPGGATFALNGQGNTATPNGILNFDTGTHTISASYSGDPSFNASSSAQSQSFTITPGFFAAIPSAQQTVLISAPGSPGTTSLTVSNSSGFSGNISLACSGLPSEAACMFAPTTITANGTANTTSVSITVTTKAPTATARSEHRTNWLPGQWVVGIGLLCSSVLVGGKRQRVRGFFLLLTLALIVAAPGCGGGSHTPPPPPDTGTPTGVSTISVTASSGLIVSTSTFTLIVQ